MTPVLCGYCPRRIVAREGQHVAKGAKALGKVVPFRTIRSWMCGILGSRERSASSVRMSRMFGLSPASPASAALLLSVSFPRHPAATTRQSTTGTSLCACTADDKKDLRRRLRAILSKGKSDHTSNPSGPTFEIDWSPIRKTKRLGLYGFQPDYLHSSSHANYLELRKGEVHDAVKAHNAPRYILCFLCTEQESGPLCT